MCSYRERKSREIKRCVKLQQKEGILVEKEKVLGGFAGAPGERRGWGWRLGDCVERKVPLPRT